MFRTNGLLWVSPARGGWTHFYGNSAPSCLCLCVCHNKPPPGHLLCVSTHHDDQQNILEVVPETQCGAAEQGKVSLQELQDETERSLSVLLEHTNTHTHAHGAKKTLAGSTNMRDTKQAEVSD